MSLMNGLYISGFVDIACGVYICRKMTSICKRIFRQVFYWSHKLYLAFWVLLIVHCEDFWKWFVVPGFVFLLEAVSTISWIRTAYMGKTYIQSVCILPSEVPRTTNITIKCRSNIFTDTLTNKINACTVQLH